MLFFEEFGPVSQFEAIAQSLVFCPWFSRQKLFGSPRWKKASSGLSFLHDLFPSFLKCFQSMKTKNINTRISPAPGSLMAQRSVGGVLMPPNHLSIAMNGEKSRNV
jgi:hypothetical protein